MGDYKQTLYLPKTSFPMKANLVQKEEEWLRFWQENNIYKRSIEHNANGEVFILHDGPPYANGHIHLGTALNKILKDIIVKSRLMGGFYTPYVPGWDCHGLPIELQVEQSLQTKKEDVPVDTLRAMCRKHAQKFIDIQRKEFIRLGVFAAWDTPYTTMHPHYEGAIVEAFATLVEHGAVQQNKKPIYWCVSCQTALAEAEVEYAQHTAHSLYALFPCSAIAPKGEEDIPTYAVIWTTTPWTLPANMALAVHPDYTYILVEEQGKRYLLAEALLDTIQQMMGWSTCKRIAALHGRELEGMLAQHPFFEREVPFVLAHYVTLASGTGIVHTAPGHGKEDYETGLRYNLEIYAPISNAGLYTKDVPYFAKLTIEEGNERSITLLKERGLLLHVAQQDHSYPHCWRCKNPIIFRATKQWFVALDAPTSLGTIRSNALRDIHNTVQWIPTWGEERIGLMVEQRPDWCISRQRVWGVPIVALHCTECGHTYSDPAFIRSVAEAMKKTPTGSDLWYTLTAEEIVAQFANGHTCTECGSTQFRKETDILDVWFDSATSFYAVLQEPSFGLSHPAQLYLEGSDQHRGWFHSSLLLCEGMYAQAPYKTVLTHGYVVDGDGRKMSKSEGNVIAPEELIQEYGAEIVRMWVASVEYKEDVRVSKEILARLVEAYRRIRNTARYMLGALDGFLSKEQKNTMYDDLPKSSDTTSYAERQQVAESILTHDTMDTLDRYMLARVSSVYMQVEQLLYRYEFHKVFHMLHTLCTTELSALYFDILKDRLYTYPHDSIERRSAQTALWYILHMIVRMMAPICSFTAEEIWQHLNNDATKSVFLARFSDIVPLYCTKQEEEQIQVLITIKTHIAKALEVLRSNGVVGHALDSSITLFMQSPAVLQSCRTDLRAFFITSSLHIVQEEQSKLQVSREFSETQDTAVFSDSLPLATLLPENSIAQENPTILYTVTKAQGTKCERCWIYDKCCGEDTTHPTLCPRCAAIVSAYHTI